MAASCSASCSVADHCAFGEFDFQPARVQLVAIQATPQQVGKAGAIQIGSRDVQGQIEVQALLLPARGLRDAVVDDPGGDAVDQRGFLGHRNEIRRHHRADQRVLPAQQCLHAHAAVVVQIHARLIVQTQLVVAVQRGGQGS